MLKHCEQCGKEFNIIPARVNTARFCSKACHYLWKSKNLCGENSTNWKGGEIKQVCEICGKEFKVRPYRAEIARFCSATCQSVWQLKKVKKVCETCGIEFEVKLSRADTARFCSKPCRRGNNNPNWQGGISFEPYGLEWTDTLKRNIRKRDNHTCAIDGEVWQEGQDEFPVHHINYCKTDNRPENLITLCRDCHIKTNHNRQYWESVLSPIAIENKNPQMSFLSPIAVAWGGA